MNLSVRLTKKTKFDPKMQKMEKKKKINFSKFGLIALLNSIDDICFLC